MNNEIKQSIISFLNAHHFTANQLAVCNVFFNAPDEGITFNYLANKINKTKNGQIGGILSYLAQRIDNLEEPNKKFGFSGYTLFFLPIGGVIHKIRPEFRSVIDNNPVFKDIMLLSVDSVYKNFPNGLNL